MIYSFEAMISIYSLIIFLTALGTALSISSHGVKRREMTAELAQAKFALDLLKSTSSSFQSSVISPVSIAVALAMTYAGAGGETKVQMNNVLSNGLSDDDLHNYFQNVMKDLMDDKKDSVLKAVNRLYVQSGFDLNNSFIEIIKSKYAGQLNRVNFAQAEQVVKEINEFVEEKTYERIKDLLTTDNIDADTRLILVNAVHFKDNWKMKFDHQFTTKKSFYVNENQQYEVDMMRMNENFGYYEDNDVQVLDLPYKHQHMSMYIFLPKKRFGLAELEAKINAQWLINTTSNCEKSNVNVQIPKFKVEKKCELNGALQSMGMTDAFGKKANFSGMSDSALFISDVIHKAFLEVNEDGTEAAASTAIGIKLLSAMMPLSPPKDFTADRPFLFALVHHQNLVLFTGRIVENSS